MRRNKKDRGIESLLSYQEKVIGNTNGNTDTENFYATTKRIIKYDTENGDWEDLTYDNVASLKVETTETKSKRSMILLILGILTLLVYGIGIIFLIVWYFYGRGNKLKAYTLRASGRGRQPFFILPADEVDDDFIKAVRSKL